MARFEEVRHRTAKERLAQSKDAPPVPDGCAVAYLQDPGHKGDILMQEEIYFNEGYSRHHSDQYGVYMINNIEDIAANTKARQEQSRRGMMVGEPADIAGKNVGVDDEDAKASTVEQMNVDSGHPEHMKFLVSSPFDK